MFPCFLTPLSSALALLFCSSFFPHSFSICPPLRLSLLFYPPCSFLCILTLLLFLFPCIILTPFPSASALLFCWILFPVARLVFILHLHSSSTALSSLYPLSSFFCLCTPLCFALSPVFSLVFLLTALLFCSLLFPSSEESRRGFLTKAQSKRHGGIESARPKVKEEGWSFDGECFCYGLQSLWCIFLFLQDLLCFVALSLGRPSGGDGWSSGWIRKWLDGGTQGAAVGGSVSKWSAVTSGVPQGSVLGVVMGAVPLNILIGDRESGIVCTLVVCAGDTELSGAGEALEGRDAIQRDVESLRGGPMPP